MIKIDIKKIICLTLVSIFLISTNAAALDTTNNSTPTAEDLDPLINLEVTVTIKEIRAFDEIDLIRDPDFYVKVFINDAKYTSPVWRNQKYVKPNWSATQDVPDDEEWVNITIQLWDWNPLKDKLCDISGNDQIDPCSRDVELFYNLKTGHWTGDDYLEHEALLFDPSGYGRLNGCDDNSIYEADRDCELLFDISQNDYDGDGIPYWTEVNVYGTDPEVDDTGIDDDGDGVPIEWEHKWGHYLFYDWHHDEYGHRWIYDPFEWENHTDLDPDEDGLDNVEEYLTSQWGSSPFGKDLFMELDQMEEGPNGEGATIPDLSKELLRDAYGKHNIFFHIDDGSWGEDSESDMIPFDESTTGSELQDIYWEYFLNGNPDNWRQGVFHYALMIYNSSRHYGFVFWGGDEDDRVLDSFQLSTKYFETRLYIFPFISRIIRRSFDTEYNRAVIYAGSMMHETGHTIGIFGSNTPGCDDSNSVWPWQKNWWKWRPYESCMNYRYVLHIVDYSDGSRGKNDFDDWARVDLTFFQRDIPWY